MLKEILQNSSIDEGSTVKKKKKNVRQRRKRRSRRARKRKGSSKVGDHVNMFLII